MTRMRNKRQKQDKRQKQTKPHGRKWRQRLRNFGIELLCALGVLAVLVSAVRLERCTVITDSIPLYIFIPVVIIAVLYWAWLKNDLSRHSFIIYTIIGFVAGVLFCSFSYTMFLGTNYLFSRSEDYQRMVVIAAKKKRFYSRGYSYRYFILRFLDDNRTCYWRVHYDDFERLGCGDTCTVTLRDGILGYTIIRNVELTGTFMDTVRYAPFRFNMPHGVTGMTGPGN